MGDCKEETMGKQDEEGESGTKWRKKKNVNKNKLKTKNGVSHTEEKEPLGHIWWI